MAFTFATWNVLATAYLRASFYPHTSPDLFKRSWRIPALAERAAALNADLLCLQEVETEVFAALLARLGPLGYEGRHHLKPGNKPDGCAAFFRTSQFQCKDDRCVPFEDGSGHIAQILRLEHGGDFYEVLNTHLKWGPQFAYRQMLQAVALLGEEATACQILCGDLNVTPDSDVIAGLLEAGFDYPHRGMAEVRTCNSNRKAKMIDYIFYRGPVTATPVMPVEIEDETPLPAQDQPSDHLPLLAHFSRIY